MDRGRWFALPGKCGWMGAWLGCVAVASGLPPRPRPTAPVPRPRARVTPPRGACPNQPGSLRSPRRCVAGPRPRPLVVRANCVLASRPWFRAAVLHKASDVFRCISLPLLRYCPSISPAPPAQTLLLDSAYLIRKGETGSDDDARPGALSTVKTVVLLFLVAGVPSSIGYLA